MINNYLSLDPYFLNIDKYQRYFLTYLNGGWPIAIVILWCCLNQ